MPARGRPVLGIDFGTTHSSIAAWIDGEVRIARDGGEQRIPSLVHVPRRGDPIVGAAARGYAFSEPHATAIGIKRVLGRAGSGRDYDALRAGSFQPLARGTDGLATVVLRGEPWPPVQLVASLLRHLRARAEHAFGGPLTDAVMTTPVDTPAGYQPALIRAAELAGVRVCRFLPEPIAALIACGIQLAEPGDYVVCDLGGGTTDLAVARWDGHGVVPIGYDGDDQLGGDDFDLALADGIAGAVFRRDRVDLRRDVVAWGTLRAHCEAVKRALSVATEAHLVVRELYTAGGRRQDIDVRVDRAWAEARWEPLLDRVVAVVARALEREHPTPAAAEGILLVGGTAQVPAIQRRLAEALGREVVVAPGADVVVATGAAIVGAAVHGVDTPTRLIDADAASVGRSP